MPHATRAGDILAERYRLVDLLSESGGGRFWRAHDRVLERHVAIHVIPAGDPRADLLHDAAQRSATVLDHRILRVLDAARTEDFSFVVNEWGSGTSLDIMLASNGPLTPRRGSWLVAEVADSIARAHAQGVAHGVLSPENVLVDDNGSVRIIGMCVDAALHGMPPGEPHHDVVDLAGMLYATLTGRWAGFSPSAVPRAPENHGRILRPRQVRAGVPRELDDLCDGLLNPRERTARDPLDPRSARAIQRILADFVGDATGIGVAIALSNPDRTNPVVLPPVPEVMAPRDPDDPMPATPQEPEASRPAPPPPPSADGLGDIPTRAGMPIFDDENDEVTWLHTHNEPAPPPPPFEAIPERPLFASEERTPRYPRPDAGTVLVPDDDYWSFDRLRTTGESELEDTAEQVPGRNWLRLAMLVAVVLVLVVAIAIAVNIGRGKTPLGADPDDEPSVTDTPTQVASETPPVEFTGLTASDLDPQGDGEEKPEDVGAAVDGDPATSWTTLTYKQPLGPRGLKRGVGLVVDLGEERAVRRVDLELVGAPTSFSLYLTSEIPDNPEELQPVAVAEAVSTPAGFDLPDAPTGRYLTVWLTSLPEVNGGFRGGVTEVRVAG